MLARTSKVYWPGFLGASQSNFQRRHACQDNGAAAQARSGGGEHLVPGGVRDELVEGLADDRGRGATLRRCLDLGIPRVMSVLDPAIRISAAHPWSAVQVSNLYLSARLRTGPITISMSASSRTMRGDLIAGGTFPETTWKLPISAPAPRPA